uniref:Tyrosine specific protein phosphatases domain-containing protein n=1 Tax=Pyrodinium bahamense TaxID=73915 RepID=A0A7S0FA73_9DINO|mmetsp:Transcript_15552/g.42967  ORF Transcript_15552/g.42967 Transcript_15552/m.42967 type:complete len:308 (+) Transcript_15552:85-1008(+)|eukprot:CAMPEP_0179049112 /NCGR_PEP_ID=MMETSP0796-20121207/20047_1 /TAXON_ID=73915 /ORGANISM="Pyrodinium bahamense, Strain pbaha01" /LENGTH=307 /DNA_ID=CAMNT_0020745583 /DNA_START=219 /DNA_END=1142 /DNA_ORIENTATION=+
MADAFRDVASSLAPFLQDGERLPIPAGVLLRGPLLQHVKSEELRTCRTVLNLRQEVDEQSHFPSLQLARLIHSPLGNKTYAYDTCSDDVKTWLVSAVSHFEMCLQPPVLIHCKHGRDRTGVVVAVLLLILGASPAAVVQEFMLSEGAKERHLRVALDGIREAGGVDAYFKGRLDLEAIRKQWSSSHIRHRSRGFYRSAQQAARHGTDPQPWCESLLTECKRGLELDPEDPEIHAAAGWALGRLGLCGEARQAFSRGLRASASRGASQALIRMMEQELASLREKNRHSAEDADETGGGAEGVGPSEGP